MEWRERPVGTGKKRLWQKKSGSGKGLGAAWAVGAAGWYGVSAYPTNERYMRQKQMRGGILAWRRNEEER